MKTQDVIDPDFKQQPVILISNEKKLQLMANPVYFPIFMSLREGYKSVKEIEEDYSKLIEKEARKKGVKSKKEIKEFVEKNRRSGKSLYRYIQHLIDADFVVTIGKRVSIDKPMTEKLFARTAKFFFVDSYSEKMFYKNPNCIESVTQLLELIYNVPKPSRVNLEEFTSLMNDSSQKITSLLFGEKSEEFVQIVENLSLDEVTDVLQMLSIIEVVSKSKNFAKLIKSLEK
ncbi:MAG: hypothetical protein KGD64_03940 [Candidatus Heimdallarchaeota archaeon]|nr:hypothetical protein [Candidatus Heimdallarchaeota archaeon]